MPIQTVDKEGLRPMIKKWTLDTICCQDHFLNLFNGVELFWIIYSTYHCYDKNLTHCNIDDWLHIQRVWHRFKGLRENNFTNVSFLQHAVKEIYYSSSFIFFHYLIGLVWNLMMMRLIFWMSVFTQLSRLSAFSAKQKDIVELYYCCVVIYVGMAKIFLYSCRSILPIHNT